MDKPLYNPISLENVDEDDWRYAAFVRIVNTDLIDLINTGNYGNRDRYYIRQIYDGISLYPSSTGIILTLANRDKFLSELIETENEEEKIEITEGELLNTQPIKMFYGWRITFVYKKHTFIWQHWNRIDMYEMDKRLEDYQEYKSQCIINGEDLQSTHDLVEKLDRCIENYKQIKGNEPTEETLPMVAEQINLYCNEEKSDI